MMHDTTSKITSRNINIHPPRTSDDARLIHKSDPQEKERERDDQNRSKRPKTGRSVPSGLQFSRKSIDVHSAQLGRCYRLFPCGETGRREGQTKRLGCVCVSLPAIYLLLRHCVSVVRHGGAGYIGAALRRTSKHFSAPSDGLVVEAIVHGKVVLAERLPPASGRAA